MKISFLTLAGTMVLGDPQGVVKQALFALVPSASALQRFSVDAGDIIVVAGKP